MTVSVWDAMTVQYKTEIQKWRFTFITVLNNIFVMCLNLIHMKKPMQFLFYIVFLPLVYEHVIIYSLITDSYFLQQENLLPPQPKTIQGLSSLVEGISSSIPSGFFSLLEINGFFNIIFLILIL